LNVTDPPNDPVAVVMVALSFRMKLCTVSMVEGTLLTTRCSLVQRLVEPALLPSLLY